MGAKVKKYRVLCWGACAYQAEPCGIEYFGKRHEEGEVVDDIPPADVRDLVAGKYIELVTDADTEEAVQE